MAIQVLVLEGGGGGLPSVSDWSDAELHRVGRPDGLDPLLAQDWALVLVFHGFDGGSGYEVAVRFAEAGHTVLLLVDDAPGLAWTARVLQAGIADVIPPPFDERRLEPHFSGAASTAAEESLELYQRAPQGDLVGDDPAVMDAFRAVARVAETTCHLHLCGEPGTGKRSLGRFVHEHSPRAEGPFVELSCLALPDHLIDSELFGHEPGTFPWAVARRRGRLEKASGGTLFLDHLDRLPPRLQLRLEEALRAGRTERVGSEESIPLDVRVVSASARSPGSLVEEGALLTGLMESLGAVVVTLPPLRERGADVLALASHFGALVAAAHDRPVTHMAGDAARKLETHDWPGNVRELRAVLEHAVLMAEGPTIQAHHLPPSVQWPGGAGRSDAGSSTVDVRSSLEEVEAAHIRRVLRSTGGNMSAAADILGIHRNTLRRKIKRYSIPT